MPEIKHEFSAGKMNKDLDERLVPNGEYRDAMNIQVRTTEAIEGSGNAGTVQNIKGTKQIETAKIDNSIPYIFYQDGSGDSKVIGSIANEKNNTAYFFVASPPLEKFITNIAAINGERHLMDVIAEVNTGTGTSDPTALPVVVDRWATMNTYINVVGTIENTVTPVGETWIQFNIRNGWKYRPGMTISAYDSLGNNLFNEGAKIQNITSAPTSPPTWTVTLYDEQPQVQWSNIAAFVFLAPRTLNFDYENKITGINIINDLLFWTDNQGEPKKINIKRSKAGSPSWETHTRLMLKDPKDDDLLVRYVDSDNNDISGLDSNIVSGVEDAMFPIVNNALKERHITVKRKAPSMAPTIHMRRSDRENEATEVNDGFFDFWQYDSDGPTPGDQITMPNVSNANTDAFMFNDVDYRVNDILSFTPSSGADVWITTIIDDINPIDCSTEGENVDYLEGTTCDDYDGAVIINMTILSVNGTIPAPSYSSSGIVLGSNQPGLWDITLEQRKPLFELKFGRFSTRYKYEDGEYSSFGPWSEIAFLPGSFDYTHKKGYNKGMANQMRELIIKDFIPHQRVRPDDMVAVDLLYKTTDNQNVYVVKTIARGIDPEWDLFTTNLTNTSLAFGELSITTEMIHKVLPANQLLRAWDNVPKKALGQEIAANRLVYANYEQGYDLKDSVGLIQSIKSSEVGGPDSPKKSVKTIREYKWGMIFGDKYGRETPVVAPGYITGDSIDNYTLLSGDVSVEKRLSRLSNKFELTQNWDNPANEGGEPESWMDYVKYYVKETSNEYYNLVMDRWYYADDGNIWLSFPSADRNKVDEETYLILKNAHGNDDSVEEKARYKIIAIENEAPDDIKTRARNLGKIPLTGATLNNSPYQLSWIMGDNSDPTTSVPQGIMEGLEFRVSDEDWPDILENFEIPNETGNERGDVQVRFGATVGTSDKDGLSWRTLSVFSVGSTSTYMKWDDAFGSDVNMYDIFSNAGISTPFESIDYYLELQEIVTKNLAEFDGKFFVKIEKDQVLKSKVLNFTGENVDYESYKTITLAYIENTQVNPSSNEDCEYCDNTYMPRRNYQWLDDDTVPAVTSGGVLNAGLNNVEAVNIWDDGNQCEGTSGTGCSPVDAIYLALGCFGADQTGGGYGVVGSSENIINRAEETRTFWWWFKEYASPNLSTEYLTGENLPFIDGARTRYTWQEGSSWICDDEVDASGNCLGSGPGTGTNAGKYPADYYKRTGLDQGVLYDPEEDQGEGAFSPTVDGELGRIAISVLSRGSGYSWNLSGWGNNNSQAWILQDKMTQQGTLFKFDADPERDEFGNPPIYKIVSSSTQVEWATDIRNYSVNNDEPWQEWQDVNFGLDFFGFQCYPEGDIGGEVIVDGQCNNFPMQFWEPGCPFCDIENEWDVMDFTNENTAHPADADGDEGSIRVGGLIGSTSDYFDTWNDSYCKRCGTIAQNLGFFSLADIPQYCQRKGFRVEFRRIDTSTGELMDEGTRGINTDVWDPRGVVCHDGREALNISLVKESISGGEVIIPIDNAAVWETEPKENVGLDIYYEASNAFPMRLNNENTLNFVPYNSKVTLKRWVDGEAPGYVNIDLTNLDHHVSRVGYTTATSVISISSTLDQTFLDASVQVSTGLHTDDIQVGDFLVFEHPDGTKTMSKVTRFMKKLPGYPLASLDFPSFEPNVQETVFKEQDQLDDNGDPIRTGHYEIDSDVYKYPIELAWFNCYSFGNGVESNRIRDDFNAPTINNGVKVSTTFLDYGQERRTSGMIYSGLYNSSSGVNDLNEFNMAEKITKDINPSYGAIQRLKTRDTDIVIFTEDKTLRAVTNKDALYNADGNPQLVASNRVLGTAVPFSGDFGMSNNPESLAWDQYRLYWTDMQRGSVLRLSQNGITPISNVGMKTYFRDNLKKTNSLLGTFDAVNGEYNLTLDYKVNEGRDTTLSFNEGSKGWVSFKSFIPQSGQSVGGKYITAAATNSASAGYSGLALWEHHVDIRKTDSTAANYNEIINRNVFYVSNTDIQAEGLDMESGHTNSTITMLFNDMPGSVKSFNTVNYEGSQARVNRFLNSNTEQPGVTTPDGSQFTNQNDNEYYNLQNIPGWWVSRITTDLSQKGSVHEFKEKEGKWFNKVDGDERGEITNKDLNEFSVQGLGKLPANPNYTDDELNQIQIQITSDMIDDDSNPFFPNADNNAWNE